MSQVNNSLGWSNYRPTIREHQEDDPPPPPRANFDPPLPAPYVNPGGPCFGLTSLAKATEMVSFFLLFCAIFRLANGIYMAILWSEDKPTVVGSAQQWVFVTLIVSSIAKIFAMLKCLMTEDQLTRAQIRLLYLYFCVYDLLDIIGYGVLVGYIYYRYKSIIVLSYFVVIIVELYFIIVIAFRIKELAPDGPLGPEIFRRVIDPVMPTPADSEVQV